MRLSDQLHRKSFFPPRFNVPVPSISKVKSVLGAVTCIVASLKNISSTVNSVWAPKLVTPGILVIPEPRAFSDKTVTPLILNSFPEAKLKLSELFHASLARAGRPSSKPELSQLSDSYIFNTPVDISYNVSPSSNVPDGSPVLKSWKSLCDKTAGSLIWLTSVF